MKTRAQADAADRVENVRTYYDALLRQWRERRGALPNLLDGRDGVVLVGAGAVGRQFRSALSRSGIRVFAFADNGPAKWGTSVEIGRASCRERV